MCVAAVVERVLAPQQEGLSLNFQHPCEQLRRSVCAAELSAMGA